jgi:membrane fusion protein (multidrug efflux system)
LWAALSALATFGCDQKKVAATPPPPNVLIDTVHRRDIPVYLDAVATLDGYVNADIRARVRGFLKTQDYKDGSAVKAGDPLFTIESTEYVAAVDEAKAAVARAKVASEHNKVQFERYQGLFQTGTVSQQDVDNTKASVDDATAQIQSAKAQLEQANLNLSYTQIRSPLAGVAGLALVRVGNLVGQDGPTLLTTVSSLDPIRVTFPMSEVDYVKFPDRFKHFDQRDLKWAKAQFARLEQNGAAEGDDPGVELVLSDGSTYGRRGVIVRAPGPSSSRPWCRTPTEFCGPGNSAGSDCAERTSEPARSRFRKRR